MSESRVAVETSVVIGLDLGTQGARAVAIAADGTLVASASEKLSPYEVQLPPGWHEQDASGWWEAVSTCLKHLVSLLPCGVEVAGIAVDSTSGTILPVNGQGDPLYPAIMYNDGRSSSCDAEVRTAGKELEDSLGYAFGASFALNKLVWLRHECPLVFQAAVRFVSPTDFIVGRLTGDYGVSDYSNVLKTGYDLVRMCWRPFIEDQLGIPIHKLPEVKAPGELIGKVSAGGAAVSGLPEGTPVFAGVTDGTAGQIASGAVDPGSWNSTLGTTLVLKGISKNLLLDPLRRVYCHRHPEGWWMPGAASNTGAEWIPREYPGGDLTALGLKAEKLFPTRLVRYPLARRGERFPFAVPQAEGFMVGESTDPIELYAAGMEGVAFIERLAYELLGSIGAEVGDEITTSGGASRSLVWLKLRASVLGKVIVRPVLSEGVMGAALLAAAGCWFGSLGKAVKSMVKQDVRVEPDLALQAAYADRYEQFIIELRKRGYWY